MADFSITGERLVEAAAKATDAARRAALAEGHSVVYIDDEGRYIEERPDGRLFEFRYDPSQPSETHRVIIRELTPQRV